MTDTQRSLAAIATLLADNTGGDISAQDMRDLLATLANGAGEVSITAGAATTLADTVTWVAVAGTWALSAESMGWDRPTLGRLRYIGAATRMVHIACSIELDLVTGTNETVKIAVAKNATIITPSITKQLLTGAGKPQSTALHAFTTVAPNDYLDIRVLNTTAAHNVQVDFANLFAMDMAL